MARMYGNDEFLSEHFGDSSQLTNSILDYGETCHMTPEFSDLLQVHYKIRINILKLRTDITSQRRKKGQVRIKICDDNGDPFIATLHIVLLAPDLCEKLFSIITLMNSGHNCLFHKGFCTVYFGSKENNAVTLP